MEAGVATRTRTRRLTAAVVGLALQLYRVPAPVAAAELRTPNAREAVTA